MNQENKHIIDDLKITPIQMPSDSYFEGLKRNILDEVGNTRLNEKKEPQIIPMYKRWYIWGSAAAILLFAILFSWSGPDPVPGSSESLSVSLSAVSNEDIYEYLDQHIEDIDPETIVSHMDEVSLTGAGEHVNRNQADPSVPSQSTMLDELNDEEILDYLKNDPDSYRDGELDEYLLIES